MQKTYRMTFLKNLSVNYWAKPNDPRINFREVHFKFYPIVRKIKSKAKSLKIQYFWHFWEPFAEVTWISNEKQAKQLEVFTRKLLKKYDIKDLDFQKGKNADNTGEGFEADWFHSPDNKKEGEFGGKIHSLCSDMVDLFWEYDEAIQSGYGVNEQTSRIVHRLVNPLGLNYDEEMKICLSRGLLCFLLKHFPKHAVWLYVKVFRQRLPK